MKILTWKNGDKGYTVKDTIDTNFDNVSKYTSNEIRTMTTEERLLMPSGFYKKDSKVFDTTLNKWFRYDGNKWVEDNLFAGEVYATKYIKNILVSDWSAKTIVIPFSQHKIENPVVQLFMFYNGTYIPTLGGVEVDADNDIILSVDNPFEGKVVVV